MMNRLQQLFERLAGVHRQDSLARDSIFSQPPREFAALEKPACWRRKKTATLNFGKTVH